VLVTDSPPSALPLARDSAVSEIQIMSRPFGAVVVIALSIAFVESPAQTSVWACAWVSRVGSPVVVTNETALIVWDEKARTQHFIRRASFEARGPYFGFLVPTPTHPELAEAPDQLFTDLQEWTQPAVLKHQRHLTLSEWWAEKQSLGKDPERPRPVTVLEQKSVAGFNATVLKATDARALNDWLGKHGYVTRPALEAWLAAYIKAGWLITAFQIARADQESSSISTKAVRLSFRTDRPFFPYSEPAEKSDEAAVKSGRSLRVFFVAAGRMYGAFDDPGTLWPGKAVWAAPLEDDQLQAMRRHVETKAVSIPQGTWLTVFDDIGGRRQATADVFFYPSPDQIYLYRMPIIDYEDVIYPTWGQLVLCVLATLLVSGLYHVRYVIRNLRVRRAAEMPPRGSGASPG
jgi:hypothetical protein